jgi:GNAT superfamily N-acetyltransferase
MSGGEAIVSGLPTRRAQAADLDAIVETLTLAFANDPVWRPTLTTAGGTAADMRPFWDIWVRGALRHPWVWLLGEGAAVSVWIPPGGTELSPDQEQELYALARDRLGDAGLAALELVFGQFERAHPSAERHYYLSLLGTHPSYRGRGLGVGLLRANLELIDAEGVATYLESSNPANDDRYRALGYEPVVQFRLGAGQQVTGMWRAADSRSDRQDRK